MSYYAGQQASSDVERIRAARIRHALWIIRNEPKAVIFEVGTRVYAVQPVGGPLADPQEAQTAKEAWASQLAAHPRDVSIRQNAATALDLSDPAMVEGLLKSLGNQRWLGQHYAKAILGIVATDYRTSDPALATEERRNSEFARHAREVLENSTNAAMLGGAAFTLCRDGGMLYSDGKLDWDYTPLAKKILSTAERVAPSNQDVFSVVPELPKRGERPPVTVRLGGAQLEKSARKRVAPARPSGATSGQVAVKLNILVGLNGSVVRAIAIEGPPDLHAPAVAAIKQWSFAPTMIGGKPVYVLSSLALAF